MSETDSQKPTESSKPQIVIDPSKLEGVKLNMKQKRALGLLTKEESDKQKARNQILRERMIRINEERKKAREAAKPVVKKREKKVAPPPESESSSSSDEYIQKKAKKVKKTLDAINSIDERLSLLRRSNSTNPYISLLCK